jgi:hypothetical protein
VKAIVNRHQRTYAFSYVVEAEGYLGDINYQGGSSTAEVRKAIDQLASGD